MNDKNNAIILFQQKEIRRTWFNNEWWFCVADVVSVLTNSANVSGYIKDMRRRDEALAKGWGQIATPLAVNTTGGKQKVNCTNAQGLFRIIQSIPSPKAEPFKQWLAKVGYERIQEIENPELAQERMKSLYEQKGYSKEWIGKRQRGIAIRQDLTDEWSDRGVEKGKEYSILTAEISRATFGMTPAEYKKHKGISKKSKANLRDNMTDLELIFVMLGEKVTTEISQQEKPDTFDKNKKVAKRGGSVAGKAREETEKELGKPVISKDNNLELENNKLAKEKANSNLEYKQDIKELEDIEKSAK